jgi:hypothetical protein
MEALPERCKTPLRDLDGPQEPRILLDHMKVQLKTSTMVSIPLQV